MNPIGLAALIYPKSIAEFLSVIVSNEPFVTHGLEKTTGSFTRLPFLESLDSLLELWPSPVSAHLPKIADEASSIEVSTRDARKLFENGMALLFNDVHQFSPELNKSLETIREDLALSALTHGRCLLYA